MADIQTCVICEREATFHFEHEVLGRYRARYFHCEGCGCIFAANPDWLPEAYQSALNVFDTGAVSRNQALALPLAAVLYLHVGPHERFLDYAAGYGLLVRLMRDIGFDFFWEDPFAENLFARGFEATEGESVAAISAFEVLEHLPHPMTDLRGLATRADTLVFSTELWQGRPPLPNEWWYYGFEHGQHVMFYSHRTLSFLATQFGYRLITDGAGFHVFTRRPDPRGVVEQIVQKRRVKKIDLLACERGERSLQLSSSFFTGGTVTLAHLEQAVRRQMKSRTRSDHEMMRSRFRENCHAHRCD